MTVDMPDLDGELDGFAWDRGWLLARLALAAYVVGERRVAAGMEFDEGVAHDAGSFFVGGRW
jgi:hypothetical protein